MRCIVQLFTLTAMLLLIEGFLLGMSDQASSLDLDFTQELFTLAQLSGSETTQIETGIVNSCQQEQTTQEEDTEQSLESALKKRKLTEREPSFALASMSTQPTHNVSGFLQSVRPWRCIGEPIALEGHLFECELSLDDINPTNSPRSFNTARLKVIAGRSWQITAEQIQFIGQFFSNLKELDLSGTFLSDEALAVLAQQVFAPHLTTLVLSSNEVTAYGIMTAMDRFTNLTSLDISGNLIIGSIGFAELAEQPFASRLVQLNIARTNITASGIDYIVNKFTNLTCLNVSGNLIGDEGLEIIAAQPFACNLCLIARSVNATEEWIKLNKHRFKDLIS